jgi:hypothetical protein
VYATNQPGKQLSLTQAVLAYRDEYLIKRAFGHLKDKPLSLTPMYLQNDDHATGLIRLLIIGLRVLTLLEFTVRRRLAAEKWRTGWALCWQSQKEHPSPNCQSYVESTQTDHLDSDYHDKQIQRHLTPLAKLQRQILTLLDFRLHIYTRLAADYCGPA